MIWSPIIFILCVAVLAAIPRMIESRRQKIDAASREGATGDFARFSQGITHYEWHGGARGKVIVAVHGLTTPKAVWDSTIPGLVAMGYRVLSYDLYGRGLSDAPGGLQDRHFFLRQLNDLLQHVGAKDEITLLGYSMGGAIVTAFAEEQPHRVAQVLLVAPSGIVTRESRFSAFCRKTPLIGDWVHALIAPGRMRKDGVAAVPSEHAKRIQIEQLEQLSQQGYLDAILASRRGLLAEDMTGAHKRLGQLGIPVAAVWGDRDTVIPITALGELASLNHEARQDVVKGADHRLPFTHGDAVTASIRDLLKVPNP